jgi:hypothetical protein
MNFAYDRGKLARSRSPTDAVASGKFWLSYLGWSFEAVIDLVKNF